MTEAAVSAADLDDLELLRRTVADFLADRCSEASLRAVMDSDLGYDAAVWSAMSTQLGLSGLQLAEQVGGSGCGLRELALVLEECGKVVYGGPLLGHSIAAWALAHAERLSDAVLLATIADGSLTLSVAVPHGSVITPAALPESRANAVHGEARLVPTVAAAGALVVEAAASSGERGLWLVEKLEAVTVGHRATLDPTRRLTTVQLDGVPARQIGDAAAAARLRDVAAVCLANEQVGGAAALLADTVAYAKVRQQFGQPIGAFQAVKHHCADVLLAVESARSIARRAAVAIDEGDPEASAYSSIAKAWCSDAYVKAAEVGLQIHGGIGYTWEHATQLHLKRSKTTELMFGDARFHRSRLSRLLGLTEEIAR